MVQSLLRWILPLTGLLLVGPLEWLCTSWLRLEDGSESATLLVSSTPVRGLVFGVLAIGLATLVGLAASRLINASYGLFSAGLTLAWAAWGTGTIDEIARRTQSGDFLPRLAIEGAVVGLLGLGSAWLIIRAGRSHPCSASDLHDPELPNPWPSRAKAFVACLLVAGVVGWLMAPESLKGQTFAAAAAAGMLGAMIGKMTARTATPLVAFAVVAVLAFAGPVAAAAYYGTGSSLIRPVYDGSLLPIARIMPLDWLAGALVGIPIGLSWGVSMTEPGHQHR